MITSEIEGQTGSQSKTETIREDGVSVKSEEGEEEEGMELKGEVVEDTNNAVFFIFMFFGFGALLPWNMFLNISFDYFENFKLLDDNEPTWFSKHFQNAMTISAQLPSLLFNFGSIYCAPGGDLTYRMMSCLGIVQLMIIVTMVFIYIPTSSWVATFFITTLLTIICLNAANGYFQNSMFGLASPFPFKYTNAIIIGQNICGVIVTILYMITRTITSDTQTRALMYFITSSIVIIVCIVLLNVIKNINFFQHYGMLTHRSVREVNNVAKNVKLAFSTSKWQLLNIFLLFFVTLSLFPNVTMYIKDKETGDKYTFIVPEKYFMDVTNFLNFNVFAFLGSLTANWIRCPGPKSIWLLVVARFWFFFYFPAANYLPTERRFGVLFESTWLYVASLAVFAFTSGYLSSLVMMYAPRTCKMAHIQRTAGMLASFCLVLGIVCGLIFSVWIKYFMTK